MIEEVGLPETAINGPAVVSGTEPSKLQHGPEERPITVQEDGNKQEEAVLNGVS